MLIQIIFFFRHDNLFLSGDLHLEREYTPSGGDPSHHQNYGVTKFIFVPTVLRCYNVCNNSSMNFHLKFKVELILHCVFYC